SKVENITGNFNGILECKLLVIFEEATDFITKSDSQIIKDIIDGTKRIINKKMINQYKIDSYERLVFNSNSYYSVRPEGGDRKYAIFECDDSKVRERTYFEALHDCLYNN